MYGSIVTVHTLIFLCCQNVRIHQYSYLSQFNKNYIHPYKQVLLHIYYTFLKNGNSGFITVTTTLDQLWTMIILPFHSSLVNLYCLQASFIRCDKIIIFPIVLHCEQSSDTQGKTTPNLYILPALKSVYLRLQKRGDC